MRRAARGLAALAIAAGGLAAPAPVGAEQLNRIAATVGREAITTSEVERNARTMVAASPEAAGLSRAQLERAALEDLINREIMRARMERLGISVSDEEVQRAMEGMLARAGIPADRIDLMLEREGVSKKEYMDRLKAELERRKMIELEVRPHVVVGEADIQRYYDEHRAEFEAPARVTLRSLLVAVPEDAPGFERDEARQKAMDLKAMASSGEVPFDELVRQHSDGPTAESGGAIGTFVPEELRSDWADVVATLGEGEVGGPISGPDGYRLLEVETLIPGGPTPLEEVKADIRERLLDDEIEETYSRWIERIREEVHVERLVDYGGVPLPGDAG